MRGTEILLMLSHWCMHGYKKTNTKHIAIVCVTLCLVNDMINVLARDVLIFVVCLGKGGGVNVNAF